MLNTRDLFLSLHFTVSILNNYITKAIVQIEANSMDILNCRQRIRDRTRRQWEKSFMNFVILCSLTRANKMTFIHICNTNKYTYKSIYNLYCFLFSPTCFGHILTIFRAYILVPRVHLKVCSSPYNFVLNTLVLHTWMKFVFVEHVKNETHW